MNYKQKLGYTLLGAGIMLIGLAVGAIVSPPLVAQRNGVFDEIQCRKIEVVDKHNETAIRLTGLDSSNNIQIYDKHGNLEISLGANAISIFNEGKSAIFLSGTEMENSISIWDTTGKPAIDLSVHQVFEGNFIKISDKKGNLEWIAP